MAVEPDNLVLGHLRHIRTTVDETREGVKRLMQRMGIVERHLANFHVSEACQIWTSIGSRNGSSASSVARS